MVRDVSRRALLRSTVAALGMGASVSAVRAADREPPERAWSRRYGPDDESLFHDAVPTRDGGYLFVGNVGYEASRALAVKTDPWGVTEWSRTYGSEDAYFETAVQVEDGYLLAGVANIRVDALDPDESDGWVVRVGADGDVRWTRRYDPATNTNVSAVVSMPDGFLFAGTTGPSDPDSDRNAAWILATDENGERRWSERYRSATSQIVTCLVAQDDRYVFGGSVGIGSGSTEDGWLVAIDADGRELWNRTYGRPVGGDRIEDALATDDGGYLFAGVTAFSRHDEGVSWLAKLRADGALDWQRTYDHRGDWAWTQGVVRRGDGYVLVGEREPKSTENRGAWLVGVDSTGNPNWRETHIETYEGVQAAAATDDGGVVVAGSSGGIGGAAWAMKVGGSRVPLDRNEATPSSLATSAGLAAVGVGAVAGISERLSRR